MKKKITIFIITLLLIPAITVAARFAANGDGTVTDSVTGLMWQQEDDKTSYTWEQALTYCENLDVPPSTYTDWRLPNNNELRSIVDNSQYNPTIDISAFLNTKLSNYWSSTADNKYPGLAWVVNFSSGSVSLYDKTVSYYVRCVRGGQ